MNDITKLTYWLKCNKYDYESYDEELKEKLLILYKSGIKFPMLYFLEFYKKFNSMDDKPLCDLVFSDVSNNVKMRTINSARALYSLNFIKSVKYFVEVNNTDDPTKKIKSYSPSVLRKLWDDGGHIKPEYIPKPKNNPPKLILDKPKVTTLANAVEIIIPRLKISELFELSYARYVEYMKSQNVSYIAEKEYFNVRVMIHKKRKMMVNYLFYDCTEYDKCCKEWGKKHGYKEAQAILRDRIYEKIVDVYPTLKDVCYSNWNQFVIRKVG